MNPLAAFWRSLGSAWEAMPLHRANEDVRVTVAEAAGMEDDDHLYRPLGGSVLDAILETPYSHQKMLKVAAAMWRGNHWASRIVQIMVDFVWGDGITVTAKHEDQKTQERIQEIIDLFWTDPVNNLEYEGEQTITELFLWGEICMPILRNQTTGQIRLGWINPTRVSKVKTNQLTGHAELVTINLEDGTELPLRVVGYDDKTNKLDGEVFFFAVNRLRDTSRGMSELYRAADWLDILNESLKVNADRQKADMSFIWDVTVEGADETKLREFRRKHATRPKPNSVRVHNEKVTWGSVSPNFGSASNVDQHIQTLKSFLLAGFGFPNHWFASGDDANLATAAVMAEPTKKALRRRQKAVREVIGTIIHYVLQYAQDTGKLPEAVRLDDRPFEIQIPDFSGPDVAKAGSAIQLIIGAAMLAVENEFISYEKAVEVVAAALSEMGIDVDPAEEIQKVKQNQEERAKREELDRKAEEDLRLGVTVPADLGDGDDQ